MYSIDLDFIYLIFFCFFNLYLFDYYYLYLFSSSGRVGSLDAHVVETTVKEMFVISARLLPRLSFATSNR